MASIHVGDIGTAFRGTATKADGTVLDVSAATSLVFVFRRPDQSVFPRAAVAVTTGADGQIQYVTVAGDLDVDGSWQLQAEITLPSGFWHSDPVKFKVARNLR